MTPQSHTFRTARYSAHATLSLVLLAGCAGAGDKDIRHGSPGPVPEQGERIVLHKETEPPNGPALVILQPASSEAEPQSGHDQPLIQGGVEAEPHLPAASPASQLVQTQLNEIQTLYRRLHIELDDAGRSKLIIELFGDARHEIRLLGFELADRDLSSNTVLAPEVGEAVKSMLKDDKAEIRARAARLISRLVPPDAMIVLTEALGRETDPQAAEPMLIGIARWPNRDATGQVMRWFLREGTAINAACNAVWAMEQNGHWDDETDHTKIIERLRQIEPTRLRESGMKLMARLGQPRDLRMLIDLMLSGDPERRQWAANALVETPHAVESLTQLAEENAAFFHAAAEALVRHRATPEGMRRLVSLPGEDADHRDRAIEQMGAKIEPERLAEAARLAQLNREQSISLLNRLLSIDTPISPRIAKGILLLAELELDAARPNRSLEAVITLDDVHIDPIDRTNAETIKATSLVLLGRLAEAYELDPSFHFWEAAINRSGDTELCRRTARFLLDQPGSGFSEEQRAALRAIRGPADAEETPDNESDDE
ncbi:MAG: hypothetical protein WD114_06980 [Phycisphaerales bacterium]